MAEVMIEETGYAADWRDREEFEHQVLKAIYSNDRRIDPRYQNPFYSNHVFTEADIKRVKIRKRDKLWLWLFPTFVQGHNGYIFHFKCVNAAYYLMKIEHL